MTAQAENAACGAVTIYSGSGTATLYGYSVCPSALIQSGGILVPPKRRVITAAPIVGEGLDAAPCIACNDDLDGGILL